MEHSEHIHSFLDFTNDLLQGAGAGANNGVVSQICTGRRTLTLLHART